MKIVLSSLSFTQAGGDQVTNMQMLIFDGEGIEKSEWKGRF